MKLLEGQDATVAKFVADFAPLGWNGGCWATERPEWRPGFRAFGVIDDSGLLVAGVVFSDWNPAAKRVELSAVSRSRYALRPEILAALGDHAFRKLDVFRVWARTSVDNRIARATLKHIGFVEESTQAHWYGKGRHAVTARLIKPDWERRWGRLEVVQKAD